MQTIAVFATIFAVASAASIVRVPSADSAVIESHRVGGAFSYSTSEGHAVGVVSPVVQNVVSPVATTYTVSGVPVSGYSTISGVPVSGYSTVSGVPVSGYSTVSGVPVSSVSSISGVPVVSNSVGNVAVLRTSDLSGVQNVVVPATSFVQAGQTPASTVKTGVTHVGTVGAWPVSSVVV